MNAKFRTVLASPSVREDEGIKLSTRFPLKNFPPLETKVSVFANEDEREREGES